MIKYVSRNTEQKKLSNTDNGSNDTKLHCKKG